MQEGTEKNCTLHTNMNQMGNNIRIARMSKGLTLQQLEMLTGIKYQLLYRYENSIQVPNNKNRSKIEKALNISLLEPSREDYEIKQLYDSFFMLLFMGERDFHEIENNIRENNGNTRNHDGITLFC